MQNNNKNGREIPAKKPEKHSDEGFFSWVISSVSGGLRYAKNTAIAKISSFSVDSEIVIKIIICTLLLIFFAMLQTTFFVRFAPFGTVPDLMIIFTLAVSMSEGEKWGAVWGLAAAYLIEALGTSGITLLPLLYMPAGLIFGIVGQYYLSGTASVRVLFTIIASFARALFTLIYVFTTLKGFTIGAVLLNITIPEFCSTLIISPLVHLAVWGSLKHFHKSRAERTL